ncbi:hypothetical protein SPHINGO8AM_30514 [Sphingomonas sp. 8AM]|nr:hypothetical protein SPHINGO8AM_30514 [Sphingomonas sp. 8AM]
MRSHWVQPARSTRSCSAASSVIIACRSKPDRHHPRQIVALAVLAAAEIRGCAQPGVRCRPPGIAAGTSWSPRGEADAAVAQREEFGFGIVMHRVPACLFELRRGDAPNTTPRDPAGIPDHAIDPLNKARLALRA